MYELNLANSCLLICSPSFIRFILSDYLFLFLSFLVSYFLSAFTLFCMAFPTLICDCLSPGSISVYFRVKPGLLFPTLSLFSFAFYLVYLICSLPLYLLFLSGFSPPFSVSFYLHRYPSLSHLSVIHYQFSSNNLPHLALPLCTSSFHIVFPIRPHPSLSLLSAICIVYPPCSVPPFPPLWFRSV